MTENSNYSDYTAKIKDTDITLSYDQDLKKFYYQGYKNQPESVTVVVTKTSTGQTQEVSLSKGSLKKGSLPKGILDKVN